MSYLTFSAHALLALSFPVTESKSVGHVRLIGPNAMTKTRAKPTILRNIEEHFDGDGRMRSDDISQ